MLLLYKNKLTILIWMKFSRLILLALIFYSCNSDTVQKPTNHENSPLAKEIDINASASSTDSNVLIINTKTAVFYEPDSIQIEKRKSQGNEEDFYAGADDYLWYMNESFNYLDSVQLPITNVREKRILKFVNVDGESTIINLDTLSDLWGVYFFDGQKSPMEADILDIGSDYNKYFNK